MFGNYKIIVSEKLISSRELMLSQTAFMYALNPLSQHFVQRWIMKAKDIKSGKYFLIDTAGNAIDSMQNLLQSTQNNNAKCQMLSKRELIAGGYFVFENKIANDFCFTFSKSYTDNLKEFSQNEIHKYNALFNVNFEPSTMNYHLVDESWLDQPLVYGSICTKCSRDYPWVPQDSAYVCYGCKIGY